MVYLVDTVYLFLFISYGFLRCNDCVCFWPAVKLQKLFLHSRVNRCSFRIEIVHLNPILPHKLLIIVIMSAILHACMFTVLNVAFVIVTKSCVILGILLLLIRLVLWGMYGCRD